MYVTYTRIYGWSDYGGESSYQPGYRLENMMWMTLLVYDYIIPGEKNEYTTTGSFNYRCYYFFYNSFAVTEKKIAFIEIHIIMAFGRAGNGNYGIIS